VAGFLTTPFAGNRFALQKRQAKRPRHRSAALFLAMFVDPPLFCEVFKKSWDFLDLAQSA
jgi:hypothetical protein